jgi:hypothetical protein
MNPYETVQIDGRDWVIVRKEKMDGQKYALLMYKYYEYENSITQISHYIYDKSDLKSRIEALYDKYAGPVMRSLAVFPADVYDGHGTDALTPPSKHFARNGKEAFFAPTYADANACRPVWISVRSDYGFPTRTTAKNYWELYYALGGNTPGFKSAGTEVAGQGAHIPSNHGVYLRPFVWIAY